VEPSERYGNSSLTELTSLIRGPSVPVSPMTDESDDPGRDGILTAGAALLILLLLAAAIPIYSWIRRPPDPAGPRPRHRARRSRLRILLAIVVVALLALLPPLVWSTPFAPVRQAPLRSTTAPSRRVIRHRW
jgi:hypothetical protein